MRDPYEVLGVARSATDEEITKVYRKLARQYHPDRNPGDKEAEAKFKEIQNAYDILSDKTKRANFDRFGSPNGPQGTGFGGYGGFSGGSGQMPEDLQEFLRQASAGGGGFSFNFGDLGDFAQFFGGGMPRARTGRGRRQRVQMPAEDVEHEVRIPFVTAARGGKLDLNINGTIVSVTVPAGAREGQKMRLSNVLPGGGNVLLKLQIEPHPYFRREGDDLLVDVPISIAEAVLGGKVDVPTLDGGRASATVPPGTSSGAKLRLRGLGIAGGDLFAVLKIVVPKNLDARSKELFEEFVKKNPQNPRSDVGW